jgi:hypothetical protein
MKRSTKIVYAIIIGIVVFAVLSSLFGKSGYTLGPGLSLGSLSVSSKAGEPSEMQNLPYKLECVPGPQETASPYSKSLTPGGYCGIQEFVNTQADYEITGGIGESLLA